MKQKNYENYKYNLASKAKSGDISALSKIVFIIITIYVILILLLFINQNMKFKELKFMKDKSESFKRIFVTYSKIKPFFGLFPNIVSKKRSFSYSFIGKAVASIIAADTSFEVKPTYLSNFLSIN